MGDSILLNIKPFQDLYLTLGLLVPGLIVLFVRSQFVTGRNQPHTEAFLSYLVVSAIYYAIAFPIIDFFQSIEISQYINLLGWLILVFIGPAGLGLLLGVNVQYDLLRRLLRKCGLNPVHAMPTAWDWKFGSMESQWVLVTLKDGTRFAGFYGAKSFASSDPKERDIYIQWIYDIDPNDVWKSRNENGVLISPDEVQTIEFWPF
ncbi:MAG: DUF6338 family protein [Rhodospirillaceae bacterium]|nr:DUF6338 family protein [Rhodospirillaceae bacterium]MDE0616704.1 DUF6338 family protein [Rhodospirillaceae bacterium]